MMPTPESANTDPASTRPAVLAGAEISRRSSTNPTRNAIVSAPITPIICDDSNTSANSPRNAAAPNAATTPMYNEMPPNVAIGEV